MKEQSFRFRLPYGLADLFFEQAATKVHVERILEETFARWGYTRIILPTFEYSETLEMEASPTLAEEMYRFYDSDGHSLALRPDMTPPTARVVATKLYDQLLPMRFFYVGSVFRRVEVQAGNRREFTQAGVELVGANTPEADAEIVALTVAALLSLGIQEFQINLGQVAFLRGLLNGASSANGPMRRLEQAIERKNPLAVERYLAETDLPEETKRAVRAVPNLCGGADVLDEAESLATNESARQALARLRAVYDLLRLWGIGDRIIVDLGEVRSMGYYTGITYHGYAAGLGFPICSGGRYDHLLSHFGADMPAIGFAIGVERILLLLGQQSDIAPDLIISSCAHASCQALASEARNLGLRVEVDVLNRQGEELISYSRAKGARRILLCEGSGSYTLYDEVGPRQVTLSSLKEELPTWRR